MPRLTFLLPFALAGLSATALQAQGANPSQPSTDPSFTQNQPAPIVRSGRSTPPASQPGAPYRTYSTTLAAGKVLTSTQGIAEAQPIGGVLLRVGPNSAVRNVAMDAGHIELSVERGVANLSVHHVADNMLVLVDLPGGQVQALKNGFYTFNAATNTARVLKGEADAFPGTAATAKPIKVKEDHAVNFSTPHLRSVEFAPFQARTDVLPNQATYARASDGGYRPYGYGAGAGFYGDAPYYPYYGWGGPYAYGWGYPGFGFGFGGFYGGGFYGGGFGGGGFGGGRFGGRR